MKGRAFYPVTLMVFFFMFLGVAKLHAASGCVNQYDEADPNGECITSACTTACTVRNVEPALDLAKVLPAMNRKFSPLKSQQEPKAILNLSSINSDRILPTVRIDEFGDWSSIQNSFEIACIYKPINVAEGRA